MSTISIVSALLLTVPFATAGYFNSQYFEALIAAIQSCPSDIGWGQAYNSNSKIDVLINSFNSTSINGFFCSLIGIVVSTVYFVLKPVNLNAIPKWSKFKLKILALLGAITLFVNIINVMMLGIYISSYVMVPFSTCGDNKVNWAAGIVVFLILMVLSIYLLA
jgi:hypothetical protein